MSTFSNQALLPKLPVAPLDEVLKTYLNSCKVVLDDEEYRRTEKVVAEFGKKGGVGERLHAMLEKRAKESKTSWLREWWDNCAYLDFRLGLAINVSYIFTFRQHVLGVKPRTQTKAAARMTFSMLSVREAYYREEIAPEMQGKAALCMQMLEAVFGTVRVPKRPRCELVTYPRAESNHVAVLLRDRFYIIDAFHSDGALLSVEDLEVCFEHILRESADDGEHSPNVSVLTACDRDLWADGREALLRAHSHNAAVLRAIESAAFAVALESEDPANEVEYNRLLLHGKRARDRWFDKTVQLVVLPNGHAGYIGEHSPCDGTPLIPVVERMLDSARALEDAPPGSARADVPPPRRVEFVLDDEVRAFVKKGLHAIDDAISGTDFDVLEFREFGKTAIKKVGVSPDAFVQMAIHLTYFRLHGEMGPCYESAATRRFSHGRTETGRTATPEAKEFCESMLDPSHTDAERFKRFKEACNAHVNLMRAAGDGRGCDRTLLGMKLAAAEAGLPTPDIFTDPAYARTSNWALSTSQMTTSYFEAGFGSVNSHCYGVCYNIQPDYLHFKVGTFLLRADGFAHTLRDTLCQIHDVTSHNSSRL